MAYTRKGFFLKGKNQPLLSKGISATNNKQYGVYDLGGGTITSDTPSALPTLLVEREKRYKKNKNKQLAKLRKKENLPFITTVGDTKMKFSSSILESKEKTKKAVTQIKKQGLTNLTSEKTPLPSTQPINLVKETNLTSPQPKAKQNETPPQKEFDLTTEESQELERIKKFKKDKFNFERE